MCPTERPKCRKRGFNMKLTIVNRSHSEPLFKGSETREINLTNGYTAEDIVRLFESLLQLSNIVRDTHASATVLRIQQS